MRLAYATGMGALIALASALSGTASAADLPVKAPPMAAPEIVSWTGFYIGANFGYGWANWDSVRLDAPSGNFPIGFHSKSNLSGGLAGGQVGFDYQWNQIVLGVVASGDWANINNRAVSDLGVLGTAISVTDHSINRIVDAGGRIGLAWGNVLGYVKGGGAWIHDDTTSITHSTANFSVVDTIVSGSADRSGWFGGAGLEVKASPRITGFNFSGFIEWDHYDFGSTAQSRSVLFASPANIAAFPIGSLIHNNVTLRADVIKVGINWRPDWFFGPVVAKY